MKNNGSAILHYNNAKNAYSQIAGYEQQEDWEMAGNSASLALKGFWMAFCFGHYEAPYALFSCFDQAIGCDSDTQAAQIMFGLAKRLGDKRCEGQNIEVPSKLNSNINKIYDAFYQTRELYAELGTVEDVDGQMNLFANLFTMTNGKTVVQMINEEETQLLGQDNNEVVGGDSYCGGCEIS